MQVVGAVAAWIFLQVFLVIVLGGVKLSSLFYLSRQRFAVRIGLVQQFNGFQRGLFLLGTMIKNRRAVLCAPIVALAVQLGRVMIQEKNF